MIVVKKTMLMIKKEFILICHFNRNGYIIGIYDTEQKAEIKLKDIFTLKNQVTCNELNYLLTQNAVRKFDIRKKTSCDLPGFRITTDGELSICISKPEINSTSYINKHIAINEFQEILFDAKVFDEMEDLYY